MASRMVFIKSSKALISTSFLFLSLMAGSSAVLAQEAGQKTFATPQDAGNALNEAVKSGDKTAELAVLGASAADVIASGDAVRDKDNADIFLKRFAQMHRWARESNGSEALYIGAENWPFPIALKKTAAGQWYFDTKDGVQEILYRRIGKNELSTIEVCNALVDGQLDYFKELHDGSTIHQYAQKFISEEGKQNGLYWKVAEGQPESPIGPLVAHANAQGYGKSGSARAVPRLLLSDADGAGRQRTGRRQELPGGWKHDRWLCLPRLSGRISQLGSDDVCGRRERRGLSERPWTDDRRHCQRNDELQPG